MNFRLALLLCLCCAAPAMAAVRLALVSTGTDKADRQIIDLATAELSSDKDIQLLDRESINSVIQEQKLSLSGLVEDDRAIQIGKLLRADLFAIVDSDPKDAGNFSLVVFDTTTGLRLMDAAITAPRNQAGRALADAIRAALTKDRKITQGLHLVGFPAVRNVDLPRSQDLLCDTVRILLERELTASPGIAVLERSHLAEVNQERLLPTTGPTRNRLRPSLTVIQLEISKAKNGTGLQAVADLIAQDHTRKITASTDTDSPADLAAKLRDRLIDALQAQPIEHPFRRLDEARMFARDSQVLLKTGRIPAGLSAAEAAYALIPGSHDRPFLAEALWARASQYLTPAITNFAALDTLNDDFDSASVSPDDLDTALGLAARALALQRDSLKARLAAPHAHQDYLGYMDGEEQLLLPGGFFNRLDSVPNIPDSFQPRITDLRSAARIYLRDYFDGWAKSIPAAPHDLAFYDDEISNGIDVACVLSTSFADFLPLRDQIFHRWIAVFNKWWPKSANVWTGAGDFQAVSLDSFLEMADMTTEHWTDFNTDALHKSLSPIADDLTASTSPVMRIYGVVATSLAHHATTTPASGDQPMASLFAALQTALRRPRFHPMSTRQYAYYAAADGITLLSSDASAKFSAFIHLLDIAQQRRDLIPNNVLEFITENIDLDSSASAPPQWLAALEKMQQLCQSPDRHVLDGNADGTRQLLASTIHDLRQQYSGLGAEKTVRAWTSAQKLADITSLPQISSLEFGPQSIGNQICFLASGVDAHAQFFIQAFQVPLTGGIPKALARISVKPLPDISQSGSAYGDNFTYRLIETTAIDEQNFYASVRGQGVVVFPRDGSPAFRIDTHHGLPSDWTQGLAAAAGKLFITTTTINGAYLLAWNRADHSLQLLVSSLAKQRHSPLEDVAGLRFRWIVPDPPRHRLLLAVGQADPDVGANWNEKWSSQKGGLWQLDPSNGKLKQLLTVSSEVGLGHFRGIDNNTLFISMPLWVIRYDLSQNRGQYASHKPGTVYPNYIRQIHLQPSTPRGTLWADPDWATTSNRRVINNWLWIANPFSRISADGKTVQLLDPKLSPASLPLDSITTIAPAAPSQILLGDNHQLYIVNIPPEKNIDTPK